MKISALAPVVLAFTLLPSVNSEHPKPIGGLNEAPKGLNASDWSSIKAEYQRNRHAAVREEGGYRARNLSQKWMTHFDGRGFTVRPDSGQWSWGLQLERYGFAGQERTLTGRAQATSDKERIRYAWGAMEEWFVNDGRGLEHGFTLPQRPARGNSRGPLRMHLGVRGGLTPQVAQDGAGVGFADASGQTVVNYAGLKVWDARGTVLTAKFEPSSQGGGFLVAVDEANAEYPLTIDPVAQQAYLKASNTGNLDIFGNTVAISGDTVVVGAVNEDSSATGVNGDGTNNAADGAGAAYVFVRTGGTWSQQAYLKASNTGAGDSFGWQVAISGDTVVVTALQEDSSATGVNGDGTNNAASDSGAAYVFVRNGVTWTQQAYLKASNTGVSDNFGGSVSISGDTIVVGAPLEDSNATGVNGNGGSNTTTESGAAYVFTRAGGVWTQQAYLKASNTDFDDNFGESVSVSGDTIVVGASHEDSNSRGVNSDQNNNVFLDAGAAYVFVRTGGIWAQQAYLKPSNTGFLDSFGWSVAVSGNTVVVGAPGEASNATGVNGNEANDSVAASGAAYVFVRNGVSWSQQAYLKASNTGTLDNFGWNVAIAGETIVVGAPRERSGPVGINGVSNEAAPEAGAAYAFGRTGGIWIQQAFLKAANAEAQDHFGWSVAVSGNSVIVGAINEDSSAVGVNGNGGSNGADSSGGAYVFSVPQGLFISKTHSGEFTQGQNGATYTVMVSNAAGAPATAGVVTVTETIPGGLTLVSMLGAGWTCDGNTCQRGDSLPGGDNYEPITVKVNVSNSAPGQVTNQITVSGGGSPTDTVSDLTIINAACSVTLTPTSASLLDIGGSATVGVAAAGSCEWNASSNASWLTVTTQSVAAGNGNFGYTAAPNPNGTPRVGLIFVNDKTFTVTQERVGGSTPLPLRFVPVTPCRIADTRENDLGAFGSPSLPAATERVFDVPLSPCGLPATAVAYSLNMTVVPLGGLGFLSVWPTGVSQPSVSTLNASDGRVKANAAIVPAGANGAITVFASNPTQVVIDVNGYFVPAFQAQGLAFYPITPCRLADTRVAAGPFPAPFGPPALLAAGATGVLRTYPVTQGHCGIPNNAQAYATSMTVAPATGLGFLTAWPSGSLRPFVSTLNSSTGTVTSNLAIVPAGTNGGIDVLVTHPTEYILDITGYFAPAGGAGALDFYTVTPCRVVDTRGPAGPFGGPAMADSVPRTFAVPARGCGTPADAKAYSLNATLVPPSPVGFLTLWGSGGQPAISNLNSFDGAIVAVAAITPAGVNGAISAFVNDPTDLIIDVNGYFK